MKCDYCESESKYSFGIFLENKTIDIFCCDKHIENARAKQDNIISTENFKQRMNMETKRINIKPILY